MFPARTVVLIGVVFGAATEVFGGPVMSSWAHRKDELSKNESKISGLMRHVKKANTPGEKNTYLNRHTTRREGFGDLADQTRNNELHETRDSLPSIAPDALPEQLQWIGLAAKDAYFQSKQLDVNAEKEEDLEGARFDWNFNGL